MARLHGSFSSNGFGGGMTALMASHNEEFQEEDVWGLVPKGSSSLKIRKSKSGPAVTVWRSAAVPIPRSASAAAVVVQKPRPPSLPRSASKPVDVPDWAKILKEEPKKNWWDDDDDYDLDACADEDDDGDVSGRKSHHHHDVNGDNDDDDDDDDDMLPPHEFLARRMRKNRVAYSMCEGIGRTLKGRDLRNLRNAILAKTGFIE